MGIDSLAFNPAYFDPQQYPESALRVRAQTRKIQMSRLFAHSPRLKDFLQFAVEQVLIGESHRLKEYTIAVDVFGRPESFDCRLDSIVRVEARRLREKLERYYLTEGAPDELLIHFLRGSYVPKFLYRLQSQSRIPSENKCVGIIEADTTFSAELKASLQHLGYSSTVLNGAGERQNTDLSLIAICANSGAFLESIHQITNFLTANRAKVIVVLSEAALRESISYLGETSYQWVLTPIRDQELEAAIQIATHKRDRSLPSATPSAGKRLFNRIGCSD